MSDDFIWNYYLEFALQLERSMPPPTRLCVGCWYQQHPTEPFPPELSSALCASCATLTIACVSCRPQWVQEVHA